MKLLSFLGRFWILEGLGKILNEGNKREILKFLKKKMLGKETMMNFLKRKSLVKKLWKLIL